MMHFGVFKAGGALVENSNTAFRLTAAVKLNLRQNDLQINFTQ